MKNDPIADAELDEWSAACSEPDSRYINTAIKEFMRAVAEVRRLRVAIQKAVDGCERCGGEGEIELPDPASGRTTGEWTRPCPACAELRAVLGERRNTN